MNPKKLDALRSALTVLGAAIVTESFRLQDSGEEYDGLEDVEDLVRSARLDYGMESSGHPSTLADLENARQALLAAAGTLLLELHGLDLAIADAKKAIKGSSH